MEPEIILPEMGTKELIAVQRGEIDAQIATAKTFPRNTDVFIKTAIRWATEDVETAKDCVYKKPVGDGHVEGPSIRMAEIAAQAYGNLRVASRLVAEMERYVKVQAVAHDLEKNNAQQAEVVASIWGKSGRYNDSMIQTTILAAQAKARRNAIFAVIPGAWIKRIMREVNKVRAKEQASLGERVSKMTSYLRDKLGISDERILAHVGRTSFEDLTGDDIDVLRTAAEEIREGRPPSELFPEPDAKQPEAAGVAAAVQKLKQDPEVPTTGGATTSPAPASNTETQRDDSPPESSSEPTGLAPGKRAPRGYRRCADCGGKGCDECGGTGIVTTAAALAKADAAKAAKEAAAQEEPAPVRRTKSKAQEPKPVAGHPWDTCVDDGEVDEYISGLEDEAGKISHKLLAEAQQMVPGSTDAEATLDTLKSYCTALHNVIAKANGAS